MQEHILPAMDPNRAPDEATTNRCEVVAVLMLELGINMIDLAVTIAQRLKPEAVRVLMPNVLQDNFARDDRRGFVP